MTLICNNTKDSLQPIGRKLLRAERVLMISRAMPSVRQGLGQSQLVLEVHLITQGEILTSNML